MSDVLQLSGASMWTNVDKGGSAERVTPTPITPAIEAGPDLRLEGAEDRASVLPKDTPSAVTDKLARLHSAATPYLQHMMKLVQRIFLTPDRLGGPIRSVAFAGVDPRDDNALLPAAAAELLASRVTGRVCLVDADFLAPSLHHCYGVSNDIGLSDALSGTGPVRSYARRLVQGHESSLWLLPAGGAEPSDERLYRSDEGRARVTDLLTAFDYVLIASPCVTDHPAMAALGAQVDGIVMIAEADVTRRRAMRACANALRASGGRVLGTVLNNRTFPIPEAVYRLL